MYVSQHDLLEYAQEEEQQLIPAQNMKKLANKT